MALNQLNHCTRELGAAVAERQGALTVALEGARNRKEEAMSAQVSEKRGLLENAGLMTYTQELLKETDAPCFVQAARITHNRCQTLFDLVRRKELPTYCVLSSLFFLYLRTFLCRLVKAIENLQCFSISADPSFRHFHLDASKEVKLINAMDFIHGRLFCPCDSNLVKVDIIEEVRLCPLSPPQHL